MTKVLEEMEMPLDLLDLKPIHLLLFKDAEQEFFGKAASNTACERSFGFLDWWKKFASRQKTVKTNGLIMFKVNSTVDWLRGKSKADRDNIMDIIRKWKYRKQKEAKDARREREQETETRKENEIKIAKNKARHERDQKQQDAMVAQPLWSTPQQAWEAVASIPVSAKSARFQAIKQQWQYAKKWAGILKMKWPTEFKKQPGGTEPEVWWEAFGKVMGHESQILQKLADGKAKLARERELQARNAAGISSNIITDVVALPLANCSRPTKENIHEIISKATKYNGRNVLHNRKDAEQAARQAAGGEQGDTPMAPQDGGECASGQAQAGGEQQDQEAMIPDDLREQASGEENAGEEQDSEPMVPDDFVVCDSDDESDDEVQMISISDMSESEDEDGLGDEM